MIAVQSRSDEGKSSPLSGAREKAQNESRKAVEPILERLDAIHHDLLRLEREWAPRIETYTANKESARNLIHYLALRRHDLRGLQEQLAALGLSSLGRTESHVVAGIEAVLNVLHQLAGRAWAAQVGANRIGYEQGKILLRAQSDALLGKQQRKRSVRIMVTMPGEAATDYAAGAATGRERNGLHAHKLRARRR